MTELARSLSSTGSVLWGVSTLPAAGLIVRALSVKGWNIQTGLPAFWRSAKTYLYGREAAPPRKIY